MRKFVLLAGALAVTVSIPTASSAAPDGKNRRILVENLSNHTLRELYASPATSKTWEENLFGQRTLDSGKSITANIDNGTNDCYYDLKAVLDGGKAVEQRNVNVCAAAKWVIGEASNSIQ